MRALLLALAALLLGGCVTMRKAETPDEAAWAARRAAFAPLDAYRLSGRISIAAGRDGWSGTLSWEQSGEALDFRFTGPFGIGGLRIWGGADGLDVRTHKGEQFRVTDPERDFNERLGWSLPIRAMRYWLLGVPAPDDAFDARVDGQGRAVELDQRSWRVTYDEYMRVESHELPKRFVIERDAVKIKVVVDRWTLAGGAPPEVHGGGLDDLDL
jgi:outer membrane lipoprotein LolB